MRKDKEKGKIGGVAPVAQWTEQVPSKDKMTVRFRPGAQND